MQIQLKWCKTGSTDRKLFLWFMTLLLPLLIIFSLDFPINVDELLHYSHAKEVIDWYQSGGEDTACLDTPWSNLKYYGQSVDNFTALINRLFKIENEYLTRHIIGALFGWLLILFTSLLTFEITGRFRTALITALLMLLLPPVMGQYNNNLKDIPFATGYALSLYAMVKCFKRLPRIPWKYLFLLSLSIAFLVSVRIGGLIIFPYLVLFFIIWFLINENHTLIFSARRKELYRNLLQLLVILVIGWFGGLLFWPYGLKDPITHPLESLSLMEHYSISIRQIFQGTWYWSTSLPDSYLFIWLAISLPEIVLAGLLLYLGTMIASIKRFSLYEFIILFSLVFPLLYAVIIGSNLYSGWRQMYFLAVPLVILSALGIERILHITKRNRAIFIPVSLVLTMAAVLPMVHYLQNPETSYIYFNKITGGTKKAWSNYEYDYYWHGMKKAAEWVDENIANEGEMKVVASNFDISVYLNHRPDLKVDYVHYDLRSTKRWDYGVFGVNYIHPYQMKHHTWQPDNIQRMISDHENPLVVITKRSDLMDHQGISLARADRYREAIPILEKAIPADLNNFILFEYLADSYYHLGLKEACLRTIKSGKEIHPWNEKLNMIEAQLDYDSGNFAMALNKCLKIVENNSKYFNIAPLLIACYEKTGNREMADKLKKKYLNQNK